MLFNKEHIFQKGVLLLSTAILLTYGCETRRIPPQNTWYDGDSRVVFKSKNAVTMHDLEASMRLLMAKLRSNSSFASKCKNIKDMRQRLPLIIVGDIDNNTEGRLQGSLDLLAVMIRSSLFETDFLDVKDDGVADVIRKRVELSADGGLERGDLVQFLGQHDSPDFIILGNLRVEGDRVYLHLVVYSFATGKIAWEGIQETP